ncbi:HAMP domain-containing protein [Elizabethkingia argentiflava]|uniref:histidine kinase n=1 Tax=Elizabethkingia argenteiflava TaxID=2681556 RepID=A0A845PYD5_9FLAO|nr:HAMP domain-containing sensor histidine kinase [Elizabethkingia argenteiflava]NAW51090.1 HAMP domain-containing protein [Elizabethkingia argenteiflava]
MKIRTRITILFTLITGTILLAFAAVTYYTAKENREKDFYTLLKKEAITKANLFFNASVDKKILQDIYHNNRKILNEVEVAIYDTAFKLLYHDAVDIDFVKETPQMINKINHKGEIHFYQEGWQVIGLKYEFKDKSFIITAAAYDQYGYDKLDDLFKTIVTVFIISILVICIAGHFFSIKAFAPVKEMTSKAAEISATNLDLRLPSNSSKDELSELADTFNEMLNRLENSFDAQKHFVSNISHELRTPLAAIITELELSAHKDRTIAEYKSAVNNALTDARKLARLSNSLLDLAKASYDPSEIAFKPIRMDEVLLDARQQVHKTNPDYKIDIHFENDFENDNQISVNGNEYLLKVAFVNLFENGCKFSYERQSTVSVSFGNEKIILRFADNGIGISESDMKKIFTPFYRGVNKTFAEGNGIGLSLTQKIIALHKGTIAILSKENQGTTFTVILPHIPTS